MVRALLGSPSCRAEVRTKAEVRSPLVGRRRRKPAESPVCPPKLHATAEACRRVENPEPVEGVEWMRHTFMYIPLLLRIGSS